MRSTVRRIIVLWLLTCAVIIFLCAYYSPLFFIGFLISGVVAGMALMGVCCPACGNSILYREGVAFGSRGRSFSVWPPLPTTCGNCGRKLI